tara:strand:+ start:712 stop:918 length:207 start_codon:yes stop_codon:yes gene_type:complete
MTKLYLEGIEKLTVEFSLIEFKINTEYRLKNYIKKLEKCDIGSRMYYEGLIKIEQDKLENINNILNKL